MIEILESEYQKALEENQKNQKIIDRYLETQKCKCDDLVHKTEYNTYPYSNNYDYDECVKCGKTFNFKTF